MAQTIIHNNNEGQEIKPSNIIVSICCLTYNHEKYIRDTIEGFLMQKTKFPIEIIIHDDASTDGTVDIIREYEKKYPELIKPIYQEENQHFQGKKWYELFAFSKCSGKYIAECEGDDYWTDPHKLQKQVDFMEANEDYILCFTNCKVIDEKGNIIKDSAVQEKAKETYTHLDMPIFAPTLTKLFRNKYLDIVPKSYENAPGGDAYLIVWQSKFGKIKYHNYCSSVYRVTKQGVWNSLAEFKKQCFFFQTYYAILDITEKGAKKNIIRKLLDALQGMKKEVSEDSENIICNGFYSDMLNYIITERELSNVNIFDVIRFRLYLIIYYHQDLLIIKMARNMLPGFIKAAFRKF